MPEWMIAIGNTPIGIAIYHWGAFSFEANLTSTDEVIIA